MSELHSDAYVSEWNGPECSLCLGTGRPWDHGVGEWSTKEDCVLCDGTGIQKERGQENDVLLVPCSGGCGQKVLCFSFDPKTSWEDQASYFFCINCRGKQVGKIR